MEANKGKYQYKNLYIDFNEKVELKDKFNEMVDSNAAKQFYVILYQLMFNYNIISRIGIIEHAEDVNMAKEIFDKMKLSQTIINNGSMLTMLITINEMFLYELLIEKIDKVTVKNKDGLKTYLKSKYKHKYISFQSLKCIKQYFMDELRVDISKSKVFSALDKIYATRHSFAHNLGRADDDSNKLNGITTVAMDMSITTIMSFVRDVDALVKEC